MEQEMTEFSEFRESDKSLMNRAQFKDLVSTKCLAGVVVACCCPRGSRFEYTFLQKYFFKFYRFCRLYRIRLGKILLI